MLMVSGLCILIVFMCMKLFLVLFVDIFATWNLCILTSLFLYTAV